MAKQRINLDDIRKAVESFAPITGETEFVIVGVASLVGYDPAVPISLAETEDVDIYPVAGQAGFDMGKVDSLVGPGSDFHQENGFYIQRVGDWTTMTQPPGWLERGRTLQFGNLRATCLHPLDLAYNKLEAGREKDFAFVRGMIECGVIEQNLLRDFISNYAPDASARSLVGERVNIICQGIRRADV